MSVSVAIVVPTRNRAALAVAAVRSLLAIGDPRLTGVIVSNNSSESADVQLVESFCERTRDPRLLHVRPPAPLRMADHWDWATEAGLAQTEATHIGLHYDRRVSTADLPSLFDVAERRPEVAVTHLLDIVHPSGQRFLVHQMPWSGGVYEIRTARTLELAAAGRLTDLWQGFPVMVNCIVPRAVLDRVRARFGTICASTSPESCFGFRFCAVEERYLHLDRPLGIHYATARSNGLGYIQGDTSGTFGDFVRLHGERAWLEAAPLPGVSLGQNSFYHEYAMARRRAGGARLPPIEMRGYLADIARGLAAVIDPQRRAEFRRLLEEHGWEADRGAGASSGDASPPKPHKSTLAELRADYVRARPRDLGSTGFRSEKRALLYARRFARPPSSNGAFLGGFEAVRLQ